MWEEAWVLHYYQIDPCMGNLTSRTKGTQDTYADRTRKGKPRVLEL